MLPKAFSKSMKLMCTLVSHSVYCSVIFQSVKMWSMHPTPGLKPACSFLMMVLKASICLIWMVLQKMLLATERSVTPRQFVHCVLSPSWGVYGSVPCTSIQVWSLRSRFYGIDHITSLLQNGCQFSILPLCCCLFHGQVPCCSSDS